MKPFALSLAAFFFCVPASAADSPPDGPPAAPAGAFTDTELEYDFVRLAAIDLKGMRIQLELDLEESDPSRLVWVKLDPNVDVSNVSRGPIDLEDMREGDQVSVSCDKGPDGKPVAIDIIDYSRQPED